MGVKGVVRKAPIEGDVSHNYSVVKEEMSPTLTIVLQAGSTHLGFRIRQAQARAPNQSGVNRGKGQD